MAEFKLPGGTLHEVIFGKPDAVHCDDDATVNGSPRASIVKFKEFDQ